MSILRTDNLKKYYGEGDTLVKALDGIDLSVEQGEFVSIVGTSGSGKSTLLHMLGGLDRPTEGTVVVGGRDISMLKDEQLTIFRRRKKYSLPSQLSGGQQQRVAIARALAAKPAILLADEPTGNLDSVTSQDVLSLLKVTSNKFGQTVVMITHNEEVAQLAGRIVRIEDGRIMGSKGGEAHA